MSTIQGLGTPIPLSPSPTQPTGPSNQPDFAQTLRDGMRQIDQLQTDAQQKSAQLLQGDGQDVHSAMIAVEKAELSFQLMMQVRNKIVAAYQEVSRMNF
jgi:flagellar hook-basal body complex protein FliE